VAPDVTGDVLDPDTGTTRLGEGAGTKYSMHPRQPYLEQELVGRILELFESVC
jgi:hypothetical protein